MQRDQYIDERHRHRYEVNPELVPQLEAHGLRFVGKDDTVRCPLRSRLSVLLTDQLLMRKQHAGAKGLLLH